MRLVVQRVSEARVTVDEALTGEIGSGFLVLAGAEEGDSMEDVTFLAEKLSGLRVFEDAEDKMNLSIQDVGGEILLVSQFTLLGDARKGRRPSFSRAARPEIARPLLEEMKKLLEARGLKVETGQFQAHMRVSLVNDGPVTILLDSRKGF